MSNLELMERLARLERCVLAMAALSSGQAQAQGNPEMVAALEQQFGQDLTDIAAGLKE